MRIKTLGTAWTLAFLHQFSVQLANLRWGRLVKLGHAWAILNTVLALSGLSTVNGEMAPAPTWGLAAAPDYVEPRLSIAGSIGVGLGCFLVASTLAALSRAGQRDPRAKLVLYAFIANTLAVLNDMLIQVASLRSYYLTEQAALLTVVAVSAILLDRYTRTSKELDVRTLQLSTSVGELRHTEAELVKKEQLAAVGLLSGLIANQVEKPLARIKETTAGLRDENIAEERQRELLPRLEEEIDRLNRLVDDLLAYARPVKLQARPVGIRELIGDCVSAKITGSDAVLCEVDIDDSQPVIYGDADLLRTAIGHVLDNALAAMDQGGELRIVGRAGTEVDEATVLLTITDTGEGMDQDTLDSARDPFFTTRPRGTGMGLAIVDRIVKLHDGAVTLESVRGGGTTIRLTLPVGIEGASSSGDDHQRRPRAERAEEGAS